MTLPDYGLFQFINSVSPDELEEQSVARKMYQRRDYCNKTTRVLLRRDWRVNKHGRMRMMSAFSPIGTQERSVMYISKD